MIDFELSDNEKQILAKVREQSLVARRYARYYDENEHEFPPDELPEAEHYPNLLDALSQLGEKDSGRAVMSLLLADLGQLDRRHAQAADAEDGHGLARLKPGLAQGVERGGRGAHHDRALLKGDLAG